jgi:hypothetical protein
MSLVYSRSFLDETERLDAAIRSAGGGFTLRYKEPSDDVIRRLKSNNLWSDILCLQVGAGLTSAGGLINWKTPGTYNASLVNAPTFTAGSGYTTDGSTNYVDMGINPTSAGIAQDNVSFSYWSLTSGQTATVSGASDNAFQFGMNSRNTTDLLRIASNLAAATGFESYGSNTDGSGFYTMSRTASNLTTGYKNGASNGTSATASAGVPNTTFRLGSFNSVTPTFQARQFACAIVGASRTAAQEAVLYAILRAYMTAVGVP